MHTEARIGLITKIVIHTNEGPEGDNSAAGLAGYILGNGPDGGGYHATFDQFHTINVATDGTVVWGNGAVNHQSLDGCVVGFAGQTAQEWADAFDQGALEQLARWIAQKCKQYNIPVVHLTGQVLHDGNAKGICTHGDLTLAGFSGTQGHWDPGPNFPMTKVLTRVNQILNPQPKVPPMFNPAPTIVALTEFEHHALGHCAAAVTADGAVYCTPPGAYLGGGNHGASQGKDFYDAGRRAASIRRPTGLEVSKGITSGYVIVATSGETYHFQ